MSNNQSSKKRTSKKEQIEDLGFGSKITSTQRFINKDGSLNVTRTGKKAWTPYQNMVEMSWTQFLLMVFVFYCTVNFLFAFCYVLLGIENLNGIEDISFFMNLSNAFFFSVQTFTTVGYGNIHPTGLATSWVASIHALVGLMSFALATGLLFARFSKPKAQILYSKNMIQAPYNDVSGFMFRIANMRDNKIIDLEATVSATWVVLVDGTLVRKYAPLNLERKMISLFPLSWTIVHPIDTDSPFFEKNKADIKRMNTEFLVMLKGYDESFNQVIHSNTSYTCDEVIWGAKFNLMFHSDDKNRTVLELDKIDDVEYLDAPNQREFKTNA